MTVLQYIFAWLEHLMDAMNPVIVDFCFHEALLLIIPTALCVIPYLLELCAKGRYRLRTIALQTSLLITGIMVAIAIIEHLPVNQLDAMSGRIKLWVVVYSLLAIAFIPRFLSAQVLPTASGQRPLKRRIYAILVVLAAWQLVWVFLK